MLSIDNIHVSSALWIAKPLFKALLFTINLPDSLVDFLALLVFPLLAGFSAYFLIGLQVKDSFNAVSKSKVQPDLTKVSELEVELVAELSKSTIEGLSPAFLWNHQWMIARLDWLGKHLWNVALRCLTVMAAVSFQQWPMHVQICLEDLIVLGGYSP